MSATSRTIKRDYTPIINGTWFSRSASERWDAPSEWDGSNNIDVITRSQWVDSSLFRTRNGRWVEETRVRIDGHSSYREELEPEGAAQWFAQCGLEPPTELAGLFAKLER